MASANPLRHLGTQLEALASSLAVLPSVGRQLTLMRREVKGLRGDLAELPELIRELTVVVTRMADEVEGMHKDVIVIGDRVEPLAAQLEPLAPTLGTLEPNLERMLEEMGGLRNDLNRLPFMGGGRRGRRTGDPLRPVAELPEPQDAVNDAT